MPTAAIVLVLFAAVLHAGWNVLLKTSGDTLTTAVRLQAIGTIVLVPLAFVAWLWNDRPAVSASAFWLAMLSAVLEATYFVCLASAYRRGGLSLVYPLARGSAPLVTVAVGIGVLGEQLAPMALLGVGCLLVGILLVARPWQAFRSTDPAHRTAIGFALLTGASIAAYSTVDRLGVREAPPWLYGAILAVASSILTFSVVTIGRRNGWLAPARVRPAGAPTGLKSLGRDATAGVLSLTAYLLVLTAYSIAPLATVAPLRESGIVLAAAWGALRLREAKSRRDASSRIAAAALVVAGAALLAAAP